MSNYMTKAAAHARLLKLASAARLIRRQRALQKYAQAVQMQKQALGTGATAGIGAGLGGLIGGGIGYGLGKKDKKLLSALIGAGAGAGIGGLGGWGLGAYLNKGTSGSPTHEEIISNPRIMKKMLRDDYGRGSDAGSLSKQMTKEIANIPDNEIDPDDVPYTRAFNEIVDKYQNGTLNWYEFNNICSMNGIDPEKMKVDLMKNQGTSIMMPENY